MVAKPLCPLYKYIIKPLDRAYYPELRYIYDKRHSHLRNAAYLVLLHIVFSLKDKKNRNHDNANKEKSQNIS